MNLSPESRSYIHLHFVILIWGFTGIIGALISNDLASTMIVWYRMLIAVIALFAYVKFKGFNFIPNKSDLIKFMGVGMVTAIHWLFFFESIKVSNVSIALTCLSSSAFFVSIIEPVVFKRKMRTYELIFGLFVIAGLWLIFSFETDMMLGIIYALISAFFAALFTVFNGIFIKSHRPSVISIWEMAGGFAGLSLWLLITDIQIFSRVFPSETDWLYLLALGVICSAYAFVVGVKVMKTLSPFTVAVSVNMEPIYAIILALWIFGEKEKMTPGFYFGALVIFATILLNSYIQKRIKQKNKANVVLTAK